MLQKPRSKFLSVEFAFQVVHIARNRNIRENDRVAIIERASPIEDVPPTATHLFSDRLRVANYGRHAVISRA